MSKLASAFTFSSVFFKNILKIKRKKNLQNPLILTYLGLQTAEREQKTSQSFLLIFPKSENNIKEFQFSQE